MEEVVTGIIGGLANHPYTISKFSVGAIVKSVAAELCESGIPVNCISPFPIPTPLVTKDLERFHRGVGAQRVMEIVQAAGSLEGFNCEVRDIAKAALYLASEDGRYVSGHNLVVDGGFTSFKSFGFPDRNQVMKANFVDGHRRFLSDGRKLGGASENHIHNKHFWVGRANIMC